MAKVKRRSGAFGRIMLLLLVIIILVFAGLLWFDILGLIDARATAQPILRAIGLSTAERTINPDDPLLLDRERLMKREEALAIYKEDLTLQDTDLKKKDEDILQKQNNLAEREKAQDDREKTFKESTNQYDNKKANLEQNAQYLNSMPPASAVAILLKMEDQDVIDVLRTVEEQAKAAGTASTVSYLLSLMAKEDAARVAGIQRKMVRKPGN